MSMINRFQVQPNDSVEFRFNKELYKSFGDSCPSELKQVNFLGSKEAVVLPILADEGVSTPPTSTRVRRTLGQVASQVSEGIRHSMGAFPQLLTPPSRSQSQSPCVSTPASSGYGTALNSQAHTPVSNRSSLGIEVEDKNSPVILQRTSSSMIRLFLETDHLNLAKEMKDEEDSRNRQRVLNRLIEFVPAYAGDSSNTVLIDEQDVQALDLARLEYVMGYNDEILSGIFTKEKLVELVISNVKSKPKEFVSSQKFIDALNLIAKEKGLELSAAIDALSEEELTTIYLNSLNEKEFTRELENRVNLLAIAQLEAYFSNGYVEGSGKICEENFEPIEPPKDHSETCSVEAPVTPKAVRGNGNMFRFEESTDTLVPFKELV